MFRYVVCYTLILSLLANQAIAIGCAHEHAGPESDNHQHRPHIHFHLHSETHDHFHQDVEHDTVGHRHEHYQGVNANDEGLPHLATSERLPEKLLVVDHPRGHDSDAIYVTDQAFDYLPSVEQANEVDPVALITFIVLDWPRLTLSIQPIRPIAHKGPFSQGRCALFLQILSLRI